MNKEAAYNNTELERIMTECRKSKNASIIYLISYKT